MANLFAARCRERVASGELAERSERDFRETIGLVVTMLGRDCRIEHFRPMDFGELKEKLAEPVRVNGSPPGRSCERRSAVTVSGDVRRIRAFLRWAADSELITPPRFGREFSTANQKALQRQRAIKGRQDLSADDIRKILKSSSPRFTPVLLLGINAAMGIADIAELRRREIPIDESDVALVSLPRRKTGSARRVWLWPETLTAIRAYLKAYRREPGLDDRLLLTRSGLPWARIDVSEQKDGTTKARRQDSAAGAFTKEKEAAGV